MGMTYPKIRPVGYEEQYQKILPEVQKEYSRPQTTIISPKTSAGLLLAGARQAKPHAIASERATQAAITTEQVRQEQESSAMAQMRLITEEAAQWAAQEAAQRRRRGRYETIITGELVPSTKKKMLLGG
jgi:hypothetical protein